MTGTCTAFVKLASTMAIAVALVSGCASAGGARPSSHAAKPISGSGGKVVAKAERAVANAPRDAAARAGLGAAYLGAGRFASAAQAYDDALELGDESAATVLGLALAETASGNAAAAGELLHDWRDVIPAGDLGLAYALAGQTARGVQVLSGALRDGDNTAKTRQNLAFAYALDGRWREARLMAAQDVPPDQISDRIGEWAQLGHPDAVAMRVAHLLGVTVAADPGQPQALALANFPGTTDLAAEAQAQLQAAAAPAAAPEQPPEQIQAELPVAGAPVTQPITLASLDRAATAVVGDAPAFAAVAAPAAPVAAKPRVVGKTMAAKFVSDPRRVTQPGKGKGLAAMFQASRIVAQGSHWLQLGSYTNPAIAKDGWRKFTSRTPALKPYRTVTTTATVNGTPVWRVAAAGFPGYAEAAKMCAKVKGRGGDCLVKRAEAAATTGSPTRGLRR